jgi:translation initiation factor 1A
MERKAMPQPTPEEEISRTRMPHGTEKIGEVLQLLGDRRMKVRCSDGKERICRVPGRLERKLWVRVGNLVLVEPWEYEGDKKGDVIWKYTNVQTSYIRSKGIFK